MFDLGFLGLVIKSEKFENVTTTIKTCGLSTYAAPLTLRKLPFGKLLIGRWQVDGALFEVPKKKHNQNHNLFWPDMEKKGKESARVSLKVTLERLFKVGF